MAQLGEDFDPGSVEPRENLDPVPAGNYVAEAIETDVVDTRNGGRMVKITWRITTGPCEGRRIWDNINIINASEQAQKIGRQMLSEACSAAGLRGPFNDSDDLLGIPVLVRVQIENSQDYGPKNVVKGYKPVDALSAPARQPAQRDQQPTQTAQRQPVQQTQQRAAGAGNRPWSR